MNNNIKNDLCLVTGLFDLGRGNLPSGFNRSFEHYLESFSKLLQVDYPMVIYVPPELNEFVWKHRKKENTSIVNRTLDDLRRFPFYNQVQEIRVKPEWINQSAWIVDSTQAKLELYNPLVMSKMFMLNDASLFGAFPVKNYLWVDAGIANTMSPGYFDAEFERRITPYLNNKMLFVAFPYDGTVEVHGFEKNKLNQMAGADTKFVCRGGLFGGNKASINEMNALYYQELHGSINAGYMGTEESIFTILAYKYADKCNVAMIEGNGLIYKFLEDLKNEKIPEPNPHPFAWYFLVFNTPRQFEYTLNKWKAAYPKEFNTVKKYVINNSNDPNVDEDYKTLFKEYDIECIKSGDNMGINSGRLYAAEHFDKSTHDYYIFIEEDMGVYEKTVDPATCVTGFTTYHEDFLDKAIHIMEDEKLDVVRLTFSEFFGTSMVSWAFINFPQHWKDLYYPAKEGYIASNSYAPNVLNKPKINYLGVYKSLPYIVGNYHVSNWPILFNKEGNRKVYLDIKWGSAYEQTWMSQAGHLWEEGKLKIGCLLASPILHNRIYHYDGKTRRENANYTN